MIWVLYDSLIHIHLIVSFKQVNLYLFPYQLITDYDKVENYVCFGSSYFHRHANVAQ